MMAFHNCYGVANVLFAIVECVLFGFVLEGWHSLKDIFVRDDVFGYLCHNNTSNNSYLLNAASTLNCTGISDGAFHNPACNNAISYTHDNISHFINNISSASSNRQSLYDSYNTSRNYVHVAVNSYTYISSSSCQAQSNILDIAYTVAATVSHASSVLMGYVFDRYGLRVSRSLATLLFLPGVLMLSFQNIDYSWLVFPGLILLGLSNVIVILTVAHVAVLVHERQATFIGILGAGSSVAGFVCVLMKLAYTAGLSRSVCFYIYASLWLIHLLNTVFLAPAFKHNASASRQTNIQLIQDDSVSPPPHLSDSPPFSVHVLTGLYVSHVIWFTLLKVALKFVGRTSPSLFSLVFPGHEAQGRALSITLDSVLFLAYMLSPLVGLVTDCIKQRNGYNELSEEEHASINQDSGDRVQNDNRVHVRRAASTVWILTLPVLMAVALSISSLVETRQAAYSVAFFLVATNVAIFTAHFTFSLTVYPKEHHGRILGLTITLSALVDLLNLPFLREAEESQVTLTVVNVLLLVLSIFTLNHPLIIRLKNKKRALMQ